MKKFIATAIVSTMLLSASTAFAGGPVIIEDEIEVIVEKPASSVGILPLLLIPIILCVALCGDDEEEDLQEEEVIIIQPQT
jgi:hypothetical protein